MVNVYIPIYGPRIFWSDFIHTCRYSLVIGKNCHWSASLGSTKGEERDSARTVRGIVESVESREPGASLGRVLFKNVE